MSPVAATLIAVGQRSRDETCHPVHNIGGTITTNLKACTSCLVVEWSPLIGHTKGSKKNPEWYQSLSV